MRLPAKEPSAKEAPQRQAVGNVRAARGNLFPSRQVSGTGGRTYVETLPGGATNYNVRLGLEIPIFSGFSRQYAVRQARAEADAALGRAASVKQQVQFQVFSSSYALQPAARRVNTADDLLASAQASEEAALGRYRAGVGLCVDLLSAQSALASARSQQVQARWVWQTTLAQLAHDTGVLDTTGGANIPVTPDT